MSVWHFLACACFLLAHPVYAQQQSASKPLKSTRKASKNQRIHQQAKAEEEGYIQYNKQWVLGGKLYSDGWAVFYEHAKKKSAYGANWWSFEFGERKSINEEKRSNISSGRFLGKALVYGKQNVFYQAKLGYGRQHIIGGKANKNGVAVMAVYGGGLSLGLLKPYYIEKFDARENGARDIKYKGDGSYTDTLFLDPSIDASSSGLMKGLNETKLRPGVFAKTGLRFDYARFNEMVTAIECGINAEYYFQEMPIMAENKARTFFVNLYIGIEFGRRN
jgi:hypothetical protein